jgi:DNA (cytosine-5)-methyltransferase 1
MNFIDLFAGAGGLSEGFIKAGFNPLAHVELDKAACFTLKTRVAYHYLAKQGRLDEYYSYLRGEIKRDDLYSKIEKGLLDTVINSAIGKDNTEVFQKIDSVRRNQQVDLIVGGPPCQAYSVIGRAALKHREDDGRKTLYIAYGEFLERYKPKLFVFENVPGFKTADGGIHYFLLKEYFKGLGYEVEDAYLNARDYGVVQNRKRLIIIGWQKKLPFNYPAFKKVKEHFTRNDIFTDLPPVRTNHFDRFSFYTNKKANEYLSSNGIRNGVDFVTQHITRPHNNRDLEIYRLAINKLAEGKRLKNKDIPEKKRTQKNIKDFLDRFKVVDEIPHTMIAHIAKDGHHFIHPDKEQLRSISVREAARIQSFPDDFYFEGAKESQPRTAAFRQIGNAVPPLMAYKIASTIRNQF